MSNQQQNSRRRLRATAGASVVALTGLLSGYAQFVRAPGAYAAACSAVASEADLALAIVDVNAGTCDTITIGSDIALTADIPAIDISGLSGVRTLTILNGAAWAIDGQSAHRGFDITLGADDSVSITDLEMKNTTVTGSGASLYVHGTAGFSVTLDGVNLHDNDATAGGGAVAAIDAGSLTILDSTFASNSAGQDGGAVLATATSGAGLSISGTYFQSNSATGDGGAVYADNGFKQVSIADSDFLYNTSSNYGGALYSASPVQIGTTDLQRSSADYGGAIYVKDALGITDSYFGYNTVNGTGAAIWTDADVTITGSNFYRNDADGAGGVLYLYGSDTVTITDSTMLRNRANEGGALYDESSASISIHGSNFIENYADGGDGGAIDASYVSAYDSLFGGNDAYGAGGALSVGSSLTLERSTLAYNGARGNGGAISASDATVERSTIYYNDSLASGGAVFASGTLDLVNSTVYGNAATVDAGGVVAGYLNSYFSTLAENGFYYYTAKAAHDGPKVPEHKVEDWGGIGSAGGTAREPGQGSPRNGFALDVSVAYAGQFLGTAIFNQPGVTCEAGSVAAEFSAATDNSCWTDGLDGNVVADLDAFSPLTGYGDLDQPGSGSLLPGATSILVTAAPSNDLGTGVSEDQIGTPRTGSWTIGARQFVPAPPPAVQATTPEAPRSPVATAGDGSAAVSWSLPGYDGGAPVIRYTVTASPGGATCTTTGALTCTVPGLTNGVQYTFSVTATNAVGTGPASTVSNSVTPAAGGDQLAPKPPGSNPQLPAGGLPPGASLLLVNGQPVAITVRPDAGTNPSGLTIVGPGFSMLLFGRGGDGGPTGLTDQAALILQSQQARAKAPVAVASGSGFKANSPIKFYLLPSTPLGELTADASGSFSGSLPVPAGIKPGNYTLQMNGLAPGGEVRSLNLGVVVKGAEAKTAKASTKVYFAPMSSTLTSAGRAALDKLVARTGKAGVRVQVTGYVQASGNSANDEQLSTARARTVAAYLRSKGLRGAYTVSGDGQATQTGAAARRADVAVTYQAR